MALSKLRRAIDLVKDQTSIGLAKLNNNSPSLSDLEVAIVKATRHDDFPWEEKHIKSILSLTSYSRTHVGACVKTITRRLNKTKNWAVALKTLMLIHRCLRDGNASYEQELFYSTRRGTRLLNMSDFRDMSRSDSWDFSAFVRTYALYLDEMVEYRMQGKRGKQSSYSYREEFDVENNSGAIVLRSTPINDMNIEQLFSRTNHLVQIIERFLACRPTGHATKNSLVLVALYQIVKESFHNYYDITEMLGVLIDRFMDLDIRESIKVHEIFCRCSKQFEEIYSFYGWSKTMGIARISEYPQVEHIPQIKLDVMDDFIRENINIQRKGKAIETQLEKENKKEHELEDIINNKESEPDFTTIKALPPPEGFPVQKSENQIVEVNVTANKIQEIGDLLDLGEDSQAINERADQLRAIALFGASTVPTGLPPWEAFKYDASDWETTLVQSASHLSNQQAQLPPGLDALTLDEMYQKGAMDNHFGASSGSASSLAFGAAGRPRMLALPAPQMQNGINNNAFVVDPFAASLSIPPPSYVQMCEMEMKQRHLMEEQLMWKHGMQGQMGFAQIQHNNCYYNMGGHSRTY